MEDENRCVICGAIIPEGLQVCYMCTMDIESWDNATKTKREKTQESDKNDMRK